ncbi:MAG TPA: DUF4235 domain-containing protein [Trebonia sp.]
MNKGLYKLLSLATSIVGGIVAGAIFKRLWKVTAGEDETPTATDERRGWPEILVAAGLQGAIFAVVQAAIERGTAEGTRKLTGTWPGDDVEAEAQPEHARD